MASNSKSRRNIFITSNQQLYFLTSKIILVFLVIILLSVGNIAFSADNLNEDIIKSFRENTEVSANIDEYKQRGFREGNINVVGVGGGCGVVGCGRAVLVILNMLSSGANTQTFSIMAEISISPRGKIYSVKHVILCPFEKI